jgi:hypothetical protein
MADYLNLQPVSAEGIELDATFDLSRESAFCVTYHFKAGGSRSVNADYHLGLEVLLERMASLDAEILDITVDSSEARKYDKQDRRLSLKFPIHLALVTNFRDLRMDITRAQRSVARRASAQPGGGNDQKTIRIIFSCNVSLEELRGLLVGEDEKP